MEDRETARMHKYGESKTTRIMMATVPHVTSGLGLRKFQADGFLLTRVYMYDRAHYILQKTCDRARRDRYKNVKLQLNSKGCHGLMCADYIP